MNRIGLSVIGSQVCRNYGCKYMFLHITFFVSQVIFCLLYVQNTYNDTSLSELYLKLNSSFSSS